ncbi:MAG TPA: hypothetical protein IAC14_08765 [Candidatus Scybalomonas excrementigallinarum]|nr:hypothetical protein [Candidatus Scybalomonas excrementigallinarum]
MEEEKKDIITSVKEENEKVIKKLLESGLNLQNLDSLYKAIDIYKDLANVDYWQEKKEDLKMRYRGSYNDYGEYGRRGVKGTGRSRYGDDNAYGRRGVPGSGRGRYRGEEMIDEMMYEYGNYTEGKENYGTDQETMKSFKYMLKAFKDYYKHLKQEASSEEEVEMLEETAREMLDM